MRRVVVRAEAAEDLAEARRFYDVNVETEQETRVVAVLDLRRNPSWIRRQVKRRL